MSNYTETKDKVVLHLENGESHECDLVIASDGIKSPIRKQALGPQEPRFAKQGLETNFPHLLCEAIWLGISNWKPTGKYAESVPHRMVQIFGKGSYSGYYPCGNQGNIIFWNVSPSEALLEESWEVPYKEPIFLTKRSKEPRIKLWIL